MHIKHTGGYWNKIYNINANISNYLNINTYIIWLLNIRKYIDTFTWKINSHHASRSKKMQIVVCMTNTTKLQETIFPGYSSDSFVIGVDTMASRTMMNSKEDFIEGTLNKSHILIQDNAGTTIAHLEGTIQWKFQDDQGYLHCIKIPGTIYSPTAPFRILSPQHWNEVRQQQGPNNHIKLQTSNGMKTLTLQWDNFTKSVPLDTRTNIYLFNSITNDNKFQEFCNNCIKNKHDHCSCTTCEEIMFCNVACFTNAIAPRIIEENNNNQPINPFGDNQAKKTKFLDWAELKDIHNNDDDDNQSISLSQQAKLYLIHVRASHIPFQRIKEWANQGLIPRTLANCEPPLCAACTYGKQSRKPWRTKALARGIAHRKSLQPGDVISVDQLYSTTPGFIAQLRGWLTRSRYKVATIFVDHASDLGYIHHQTSTSMDETLEAKQSFE
jgi:hypothetical protein